MASRFWVGGTGTWDNSDTTHWASGSGTAGGQSVPSSSDTVTFDGSSGGGTVTVAATINASNTILGLTAGAFTGTLDFSVNNPSIIIGGGSTGISFTGTGARTIKMGTGTFTISGGLTWDLTTTTNLNASSSFNACSIVMGRPAAGNGGQLTFGGGAQAYGSVSFPDATLAAAQGWSFSPGIGASFVNLTIGATVIYANVLQSFTVTNLTINGISAGRPALVGRLPNAGTDNKPTITVTSATINYAALRSLTFSGSPTANNSMDLGENSGITINPPSAATSARVIGA